MSKIYKCNFPGCNYKTAVRSQIENHHIEQQSDGGSNKSFNRVLLCPNHHARIHVPDAKTGKHKIKSDDSLVIEGWLTCTLGSRVLVHMNMEGHVGYTADKNIGNVE